MKAKSMQKKLEMWQNIHQTNHVCWIVVIETLEFTHNHDATDEPLINNGNVEPLRVFGHVTFNTNNVYNF